MARLSADTIVIGDPWNLIWVRHRLHFGLEDAPALKEGAELARTYSFWAWAKPSALAALGQQARGNSPIQKIRFGVNLNEGFRMDTFLDTADPDAAQRVLESSLKSAPRDLRAAVEGASVHYALILDRTQAQARFASLLAGSTGAQFAQLLTAARTLAQRTPSASHAPPAKVVIEGLDDGPREVAMPAKKQQ